MRNLKVGDIGILNKDIITKNFTIKAGTKFVVECKLYIDMYKADFLVDGKTINIMIFNDEIV